MHVHACMFVRAGARLEILFQIEPVHPLPDRGVACEDLRGRIRGRGKRHRSAEQCPRPAACAVAFAALTQEAVAAYVQACAVPIRHTVDTQEREWRYPRGEAKPRLVRQLAGPAVPGHPALRRRRRLRELPHIPLDKRLPLRLARARSAVVVEGVLRGLAGGGRVDGLAGGSGVV